MEDVLQSVRYNMQGKRTNNITSGYDGVQEEEVGVCYMAESVLSPEQAWRGQAPQRNTMSGVTCDNACLISQRAAVTVSDSHAMPVSWSLPFLEPQAVSGNRYALIILNQPFSAPLLQKLWRSTDWHCCADGGANRLHDVLLSQSSSGTTSERDSRFA